MGDGGYIFSEQTHRRRPLYGSVGGACVTRRYSGSVEAKYSVFVSLRFEQCFGRDRRMIREDWDVLREGWAFEAKLAQGRDGRGEVPASFWETYSAFANTDGGVIVLGAVERNGLAP